MSSSFADGFAVADMDDLDRMLALDSDPDVDITSRTAPPSTSETAAITRSDSSHVSQAPRPRRSTPHPPTAPSAPETNARPQELAAGKADEVVDESVSSSEKRLRAVRRVAFEKLLDDNHVQLPQPNRTLERQVTRLRATPANRTEEITEQLKTIGQGSSPASISILTEFSRKQQREIRTAAAEAIVHISHPAAAVVLMKLLTDSDRMVREAGVRGLVRMAWPETVETILCAGLAMRGGRSVVISALEQIPDPGRPDMIAELRRLCSHSDIEVASFAIGLLGRMENDELLADLGSLTTHPSAAIRAAVVEALVHCGLKQAITLINRAMDDPAPEVRRASAFGLASVHSPRSLQLLERALSDDDDHVRHAAASSLARIESSNSNSLGGSICQALQRENDPSTIELLVTALGRHGSDESVPVLLHFARQSDSHLQEIAVKGLRRRRSPLTIPFFQDHLTDANPANRRSAVDQLALLKVKDSVSNIREMLRIDPDEAVRAACAKALGEFGDVRSRGKLEESLYDERSVKCQAVIALGKLGDVKAVSSLLPLLRETAPEIRYHTCLALSQLKPKEIEHNLYPLLDDTDEMVRRGAEAALIQLGIRRSQVRSRKLKRKLMRIAAAVSPTALAGAVPGGFATVLAVPTVLVALIVGIIWLTSDRVRPPVPIVAGDVQGLSMSPDGSIACVMRSRNAVDLWDVSTGELLERFQTLRTTLGAVVVPETREVLLFDQDAITRRPIGATELGELPETRLTGRFLWVTTNQATRTIQVFQRDSLGVRMTSYDIADLKKGTDVLLKTSSPKPGVVSPNGAFVAVPTNGGQLEIFITANGRNVTLKLEELLGGVSAAEAGNVSALAFSDDQKYLAISTSAKKVIVFDLIENRLARTVLEDSPVPFTILVFRPGTHDLLAVARSGHVGISLNDFEQEEQFQLEGPDYMDRLAVSADVSRIAIGEEENSDVWIFDISERKQLHHFSE
ncbi:MAG: HEAT repeat domain-containing protein [Planctomycetaceae bacterium]|nr:HEAT repeat domain-containing protein [Planctomycetaceae bacterium]